MIHKVKISNFKSINELEIELGRVNVFIGENGCGKTNILEAIALGSVVANGGRILEDIQLSSRGVRITDSHLMQSIFVRNSKNKNTVKIEFSNKEGQTFPVESIYETDNKDGIYTNNWYNYPDTNSFKALGDKLYKKVEESPAHYSSYARFFEDGLEKLFGNKHILRFFIYCPENYFLRRFEEEGHVKPLGIRGEGLFKHLTFLHKKHPEIIEKLNEKLKLIDWFGGFEIPNDLMFTEKRLNIKDKYLEGLDYFDQRSANEGFLYLLFYFTLFMSPYTPGFFAIDNIDTALNPKLAARLIKELTIIAKENNKQVLLTTHNPGLLDGLDLKDDAQRLFSIYRDIDGETSAHRIMPLKPINGREPVRLSEAFVRGYIGALPQNF